MGKILRLTSLQPSRRTTLFKRGLIACAVASIVLFGLTFASQSQLNKVSMANLPTTAAAKIGLGSSAGILLIALLILFGREAYKRRWAMVAIPPKRERAVYLLEGKPLEVDMDKAEDFLQTPTKRRSPHILGETSIARSSILPFLSPKDAHNLSLVCLVRSVVKRSD